MWVGQGRVMPGEIEARTPLENVAGETGKMGRMGRMSRMGGVLRVKVVKAVKAVKTAPLVNRTASTTSVFVDGQMVMPPTSTRAAQAMGKRATMGETLQEVQGLRRWRQRPTTEMAWQVEEEGRGRGAARRLMGQMSQAAVQQGQPGQKGRVGQKGPKKVVALGLRGAGWNGPRLHAACCILHE